MRAGSPARPDRPAIRMHQTHDASGTPAPAEFLEHVPPPPLPITAGSSAMRFLGPLNPSRIDREFAYYYSDPDRGSGWLELEGFTPGDAGRIQELVRMEEIVRVVGREPRKNADLAYGNALIVKSNNPWIIIVFSVAGFGLGAYALFWIPTYPHLTWLYAVTGGLLMALGLLLGILTARRVPWWHRARRYARTDGEKMPSDLSAWG